MKKLIVLFVLMLICSVSVFAQTDVTTTTDASVIDAIYNCVIGFIPAKLLTIILFAAWVLEYIITYVKWTPANSTAAFLWNILKKLIGFLALKKK